MIDQAQLEGTPRPAMPATKTRAKRAQADITETPLFGQERAARERELDAAQLTITSQED